MGEKIIIQPVSRIEGHAKVSIILDDAGNVSDVKVNVMELRGFERFCTGRPVEELPRIVTRICGVCSWAHHIASAKAADMVFNVEIPSPAKKIRELAYMGHFIHSHLFHFYFLAAPDFIMGPDGDYRVRNVTGIAKLAPDLAKEVVRVRFMGQMISEIVGGKAIHPDAAVPGGFSKPLTREEADRMLKMARECLDFARFSIKFAKENIFSKHIDAVKTMGAIKTGFLGTVTPDGALNLYDGKLRMMQADGKYEDFEPVNYLEYIAEHVEPWTYLKFPYYRKAGKLNMDIDSPEGVYRVNALARVNVCDGIPTPNAQAELKEFRDTFGRLPQQPLLHHWARLIELIYAGERALQLLSDPELLSRDIRKPVVPGAARGVGAVEAPRGTLIHDYETDENGMVKDINLLVATCQNNAAINMSVKKAAMDLIKNGRYDEGILNRIEMVIRAHDPCMGCATHTLRGIALKLEIRDSSGRIIDTLTDPGG